MNFYLYTFFTFEFAFATNDWLDNRHVIFVIMLMRDSLEIIA